MKPDGRRCCSAGAYPEEGWLRGRQVAKPTTQFMKCCVWRSYVGNHCRRSTMSSRGCYAHMCWAGNRDSFVYSVTSSAEPATARPARWPGGAASLSTNSGKCSGAKRHGAPGRNPVRKRAWMKSISTPTLLSGRTGSPVTTLGLVPLLPSFEPLDQQPRLAFGERSGLLNRVILAAGHDLLPSLAPNPIRRDP